jgi:hypothetical protein
MPLQSGDKLGSQGKTSGPIKKGESGWGDASPRTEPLLGSFHGDKDVCQLTLESGLIPVSLLAANPLVNGSPATRLLGELASFSAPYRADYADCLRESPFAQDFLARRTRTGRHGVDGKDMASPGERWGVCDECRAGDPARWDLERTRRARGAYGGLQAEDPLR